MGGNYSKEETTQGRILYKETWHLEFLCYINLKTDTTIVTVFFTNNDYF